MNYFVYTDAAPQSLSASKKLPKPSDFIRLYDAIIQSLGDIMNLSGVDEDQEFLDEISAQKLAFQAYRCFYVAQIQVGEKKWAEAMALYDRVLEHAKEALQAMNTVKKNKEYDFINVVLLEELIEKIAFNRYRVHSLAVLDGVRKKEPDNDSNVDTSTPLMDRLDVYHDDPAVSSLASNKPNQKVPSFTSSYPPSFEPVPCKPIFFDLALNHNTFPSLESKLATKQGQQKAGITGLISNWWGWGGKK